MKNLIYILFLIPFFSMAQPRPKGGIGHEGSARHEKIRSAKIGMITERLNLTPEQAPAFWAVYNEYDAKRMELRRSIRRSIDETRDVSSSDEKIINSQKQITSLRRKELDLEEDYTNKLLKTINARQLAELRQTEANFNKMLIEKLNEKE